MPSWDGQVTLDPNAWLIGPIIGGINYSEFMPLHPLAPWWFQFPTIPGGPDYVYTHSPGALNGFNFVHFEFDITNGDGPFFPTDSGGPGVVRLYLESAFNDWVSPNGRFWSEATILGPGHYSIDYPLDPARWTNVYGQHDAAGFAQILAVTANVGFTFGGSFNHGVWSEDPAHFNLVDYDFLEQLPPPPTLPPIVQPTGPTDIADLLIGTDDPNTIAGLGGNDTIVGLAGADVIYGNLNDDLIYGNRDDDRLYGGQSNDTVYGGAGFDIIYGNQEHDLIYGNFDADHLYGGKANDTVYGGQGDDTMWLGEGNDYAYGGAGTDVVVLSGTLYSIEHKDGGVYLSLSEGYDFIDASVEKILLNGQELVV